MYHKVWKDFKLCSYVYTSIACLNLPEWELGVENQAWLLHKAVINTPSCTAFDSTLPIEDTQKPLPPLSESMRWGLISNCRTEKAVRWTLLIG